MRVWAITSIALVAVALAFSASSPAASIEWDFCNKVPAGTGPYAKGACIPLGGTDNFARSPLIEPEAVPFMLESRPELDRPVLRVWPGRRHVLRGHERPDSSLRAPRADSRSSSAAAGASSTAA